MAIITSPSSEETMELLLLIAGFGLVIALLNMITNALANIIDILWRMSKK